MNENGYVTFKMQTEALVELREFVKDNLRQIDQVRTTYSVESINEFLEETLKAIG